MSGTVEKLVYSSIVGHSSISSLFKVLFMLINGMFIGFCLLYAVLYLSTNKTESVLVALKEKG